jgi:hypothetical protein
MILGSEQRFGSPQGSLIWGDAGSGSVWTPNGKRILVTLERH